MPYKQQSDTMLEENKNQDNQKKNVEIEEVNKSMHNFNLENELGKIKIPMPFTELLKNPSYKNPVLKMIGLANSQLPSDIVNLQ